MPRALIIDDEANARRDLRAVLAAHPDVIIAGEAATVEEGRALLRSANYDLVFLDVQLFGGTGFDLMPDVAPGARTIFVSAYDHFALRAFEVNALDYLQKPVRVARLAETLRRASASNPPFEKTTMPALRPDDIVQVKTGPGIARFVRTADIVALQSQDNYSEVNLVSGERLLVRQTLSSWEDRLPTSHFLRVHRTAIINVSFVQGYHHEDSELSLIRLEHLQEPVRARRHYWPEFTAKLTALGRKLEG
ncbi:LytR/AlgR family response regulator transcription factor [Oleiharenicola lentus]|uniref:LytR/AlgR family response regulator transcription factor n=1 Tax=Oleiharenicola lentus TaxID=2508720 RepID=UPI003F669A57